MRIEFNIKDSDIEQGIAKWAVHHTSTALDDYLMRGGLASIIHRQVEAYLHPIVEEQLRPILTDFEVSIDTEAAAKIRDDYILKRVKQRIESAVRAEAKKRRS